MPAGLHVDESGFPVIVVTVRGAITADLHDGFFAKIDLWIKARRQYALIVDISGANVPSAVHRKQLAEGVALRQSGVVQYCVGTAFVLTSAVLRGTVTAVLWLQPMKQPHAVVSTVEAGRAMCVDWLARPTRTP